MDPVATHVNQVLCWQHILLSGALSVVNAHAAVGGQALKLSRSKGTWNAVDGPVAALLRTCLRLRIELLCPFRFRSFLSREIFDFRLVSPAWLRAWVRHHHERWVWQLTREPDVDWRALAQLLKEYKKPLQRHHALSICSNAQWTQENLFLRGGAAHPYCEYCEVIGDLFHRHFECGRCVPLLPALGS
eukprot:5749272-Amphidinium_carterae.2